MYATGTITLTTAPAAPAAADDVYGCLAGAPCARGAAEGLLANDGSANAGAAPAVDSGATAQPAEGALALAANGSFVFTPSS